MRTLEGDIADVIERLQQRETELLRAEQLARVGQLAAGLAHELRNPLMPMKMLVQAAIDRGDDVGLKGRSLQVLNDEIVRLEGSIQAFLDFARPPVLEKTSVDINEVVTGTLELVMARARQQHVDIRLMLPERKLLVRIDRAQIRQLLLNLLLNALDALTESGVIDILVELCSPAVAAQALPDATLRVPGCEWLSIRIADSGPGIPAELLPTIFEPFVTTKETGTGLGLSISQRIAAAHGGALSVRNRYVGGAEFTLLLPFDSEPSAAKSLVLP
jgi:signal transduction histidine kinase